VRPRVDAVLGLGRTVADLGRTEAFYRDGLGFRRLGPIERIPVPLLEALDLPDASGECLRMGLGEQTIAFLAFDAPGRHGPVDAGADETGFQHAAIVVTDIARAYAQIQRLAPTPISQGGPRVLPASSGGVMAWKFRDPDGHPLELLAFPHGEAGSPWAGATELFAGIDHSAIVVTDIDAAIAFFRDGLGLELGTRGLNRGPEQAALDGLADPVVNVIALAPTRAKTPHVELLHYRAPPPPRASSARNRFTTRFHCLVNDLPGLLARLSEAYPVILSRDGRMAGLAGPDGHGLLLMQAGDD